MQRRIIINSGGHYPVLRAIAILYLISAGMTLLGGIIGAIWALVGSGPVFFAIEHAATRGAMFIQAGIILGIAFLSALFMCAIAEGIKQCCDMANSLRAIATGVVGGAAPMIPGDGNAPRNRIDALDSLDAETAEMALLRGH